VVTYKKLQDLKKSKKGFTLVELIVVLVILAILAAILVPTLIGYIDKAKQQKDFATAQTVRVAAQAALDQEYGDTNTKITKSDNTAISGVAADATSTDDAKKYSKMVYTLSGVDTTKVTAFGFAATDSVISGGTVTIDGHSYVLTSGTWTAS
jgi:type IV pilus assembly protein PilA